MLLVHLNTTWIRGLLYICADHAPTGLRDIRLLALLSALFSDTVLYILSLAGSSYIGVCVCRASSHGCRTSEVLVNLLHLAPANKVLVSVERILCMGMYIMAHGDVIKR